jgi:hypothetical protein
VRQGDSLYLIYTSLAMEVELQKGRVERLFFLRPRSSSLELRVGSKEIIYGMSRAQILRKFGKLEEQGKGRTIVGKYVRGWLCYPTGVQFEFGKSGKLELITIFRPGIDTPK